MALSAEIAMQSAPANESSQFQSLSDILMKLYADVTDGDYIGLTAEVIRSLDVDAFVVFLLIERAVGKD